MKDALYKQPQAPKTGELARTTIEAGSLGGVTIHHFLTVFTGEFLQPDQFRIYLHEFHPQQQEWKVTEQRSQYTWEAARKFLVRFHYGDTMIPAPVQARQITVHDRGVNSLQSIAMATV